MFYKIVIINEIIGYFIRYSRIILDFIIIINLIIINFNFNFMLQRNNIRLQNQIFQSTLIPKFHMFSSCCQNFTSQTDIKILVELVGAQTIQILRAQVHRTKSILYSSNYNLNILSITFSPHSFSIFSKIKLLNYNYSML